MESATKKSRRLSAQFTWARSWASSGAARHGPSAARFGYARFGDVPDPFMLTGVSVPIASCLYLARREQLAERAAAREQ